jgi:hypothetical protein
MDMSEIRKQYPQYSDLSDDELLRGFHSKFYSDMDYEEFTSKIERTPPPEPETSTTDKVRGGIQTYLKGALFDWGDEVVGAGRALVERALPSTDAFADDPTVRKTERSIADDYRMYRDEERELQKEFADEQGGWATALELTGGVLSPLNVMGPLQQAKQGASALKAAGTVGLRSAAEGALTGAGAAEEVEDIGKSALRSGAIGGAFGGTIGGFGRALGSRKIAQELGKGDDFTPIHVIDPNTKTERALQSTYRNILGRIPGSKGILEAQQERILDAAEHAADEAGTNTQVGKDALSYAQDKFKQLADRKLVRTLTKIDDELAQTQAVMRSKQAAKALPDYVPDEVRAMVAREPNPQVVAKKLDEFWGADGEAFSYINKAEFEIDKGLLKRIKNLSDVDEETLAAKFGVEDLDDLVGQMVSGKWLMDIRNNPAITANELAVRNMAKSQIKSWHLRGGVSDFDKYFKDKVLDSSSLSRFNDDIAAYGDYKAYVGSVDAAKDLDGAFTGTHLARQGFTRDIRHGEGTGQTLGAPVRRLEKALAKRKAKARRKAKVAKNSPERKRKLTRLNRQLDDEAKHASDAAAEVRKRGIQQEVTFPSQFVTTTAVAGLAAGGAFMGYPLAIPLTLAGSRAGVTQGGQRLVAGQTGLQKAFQDEENYRLMAQLLRQGLIKQPTGE